MVDLTTLEDSELMGLQERIAAEWKRRAALPVVESGKAEVVKALREAGELTTPDHAHEPPATVDEVDAVPAWVDPGTNHAMMYTRGDIVRHGGRVWESMTDALNHWEPGGAGVHDFIWADVTPAEPEPESDESVPAVGGEGPLMWREGIQYAAEDVVDYEGESYRVLQDHRSAGHWAPDAAPSLYELEGQ